MPTTLTKTKRRTRGDSYVLSVLVPRPLMKVVERIAAEEGLAQSQVIRRVIIRAFGPKA